MAPRSAKKKSRRRLDTSSLTWIVRPLGIVVAGAAAVSLFVFPMRDWVTQREALAKKTAEFEKLADANEGLQNDVNALSTPEGIRRAAREQLGYVVPGEQRIDLGPMPALPTTFPDAWPYSMVTDIVTVRANASAAASGNALAPLAP